MKKIGRTKKISLSLPDEIWEYIQKEYTDMSQSAAIRDMLEYYYILIQMKGDGYSDSLQKLKGATATVKGIRETLRNGV